MIFICKIILHSLLGGNNQYDVALVSNIGSSVAKSGFLLFYLKLLSSLYCRLSVNLALV
jgi:hypothetical protein